MDNSIEDEIANANTNSSRAIASIPKPLVQVEEKLLERFQRMKVSPLNKLSTLFMFMAELSKSLEQFIPCKKGCNSCCNYPVEITTLEIELIEETYKLKRNAKPTAVVGQFHGTPCPFLIDGNCSIYTARPYVCRRHVAFTPTNYWCHPNRSNEHGFPQLRFSEVERVFKDIVEAPTNVMDIRQAFAAPPKAPALR